MQFSGLRGSGSGWYGEIPRRTHSEPGTARCGFSMAVRASRMAHRDPETDSVTCGFSVTYLHYFGGSTSLASIARPIEPPYNRATLVEVFSVGSG